MTQVDLSFLYNEVILLFRRVLLWHFTIWGANIYFQDIIVFCILVGLFVMYIKVLRGV